MSPFYYYFDFLVEINQFLNLDLLECGFYAISVSVDSKHKQTKWKIRNRSESSREPILVTKPVHIRYKRQKTPLTSAQVVHLRVPGSVLASGKPLISFSFDLLFDKSSQDDMKLVASHQVAVALPTHSNTSLVNIEPASTLLMRAERFCFGFRYSCQIDLCMRLCLRSVSLSDVVPVEDAFIDHSDVMTTYTTRFKQYQQSLTRQDLYRKSASTLAQECFQLDLLLLFSCIQLLQMTFSEHDDADLSRVMTQLEDIVSPAHLAEALTFITHRWKNKIISDRNHVGQFQALERICVLRTCQIRTSDCIWMKKRTLSRSESVGDVTRVSERLSSNYMLHSMIQPGRPCEMDDVNPILLIETVGHDIRDLHHNMNPLDVTVNHEYCEIESNVDTEFTRDVDVENVESDDDGHEVDVSSDRSDEQPSDSSNTQVEDIDVDDVISEPSDDQDEVDLNDGNEDENDSRNEARALQRSFITPVNTDNEDLEFDHLTSELDVSIQDQYETNYVEVVPNDQSTGFWSGLGCHKLCGSETQDHSSSVRTPRRSRIASPTTSHPSPRSSLWLCLRDEIPPPCPPNTHTKHLIVCVHGLMGNMYDLRLFQIELLKYYSNAIFFMSRANQGKTHDSIPAMSERFEEELRTALQTHRPSVVSFVGHSLGNIIIRYTLQKPSVQDLFYLEAPSEFQLSNGPPKPRLLTYMSMSGPHLGLVSISTLVSAGMWFLQRWNRSSSIPQLEMNDASRGSKSLLENLSESQVFSLFSNVILITSPQDGYVPPNSSMLLPSSSSSSKGQLHEKMRQNILNDISKSQRTRLVRTYVVFKQLPTMDDLIGRAAHVAQLENEEFIHRLVLTHLPYFLPVFHQ